MAACRIGVGAEQYGLRGVGFGEGVPDSVEDPGVGGGVGATGPLDRGLVDHHQVGRAPPGQGHDVIGGGDDVVGVLDRPPRQSACGCREIRAVRVG